MELIHRDEVENFMDKLNLYDDSDEKNHNKNISLEYNNNDNIPD